MPEPLAERPLEVLRLLVGPVDHRRGRRTRGELPAARVVPGRLQDLLVPDVETGRDVPDGLGHREAGRLGRQELHEVEGRPRAEEAVVVVDEVDEPVVDALVVRHMRVGAVDAGRLEQHLLEWTAFAAKVVVDLARAYLIAVEDPLLEGGVALRHGWGSVCNQRFTHAVPPWPGSESGNRSSLPSIRPELRPGDRATARSGPIRPPDPERTSRPPAGRTRGTAAAFRTASRRRRKPIPAASTRGRGSIRSQLPPASARGPRAMARPITTFWISVVPSRYCAIFAHAR